MTTSTRARLIAAAVVTAAVAFAVGCTPPPDVLPPATPPPPPPAVTAPVATMPTTPTTTPPLPTTPTTSIAPNAIAYAGFTVACGETDSSGAWLPDGVWRFVWRIRLGDGSEHLSEFLADARGGGISGSITSHPTYGAIPSGFTLYWSATSATCSRQG